MSPTGEKVQTIGAIRKGVAPVRSKVKEKLKTDLSTLDILDLEKLRDGLQNNTKTLVMYKERLIDIIEDDEKVISDIEVLDTLVEEVGNFLIDIKKELGVRYGSPTSQNEQLNIMMNAITTVSIEVGKLAENITGSANQNNNTAYELPKIKLPSFSGNILKWREFWESYEIAVHKKNWSKIEKFNFLRTVLQDQAKLLIEGLPLSEINYDIAIERLKNKYNNPQTIIIAHMNNIKKLPTSGHKTEELRSTFDNIEKNLAALEALGENVNNMFILPLLMEKFPFAVREKISESCSIMEGGLNTSNFRVALLAILKNKELASLSMYENKDSQTKEYRSTINSFKKKDYKKDYVKNEVGMLTHKKLQCTYCEEAHYSDECVKFCTVEARKEVLIKEKRCFKCLRSLHLPEKCKRDVRCVHCKKYNAHHRSLCPERVIDTSNVNMLACGEETFMPIFVAKAGTRKKSIEARVFLDTGSQRSYVTQRFVKKVEARSTGAEKLSILRFGTNDAKCFDSLIYKISLFPQKEKVMELSMNATEFIAGKIRSTNSKFRSINPLAKDDPEKEIDILIGSDYFWKIVKHAKEIREGIFLVSTCFGDIIGGKEHVSRKNKDLREESSVYTNNMMTLEASIQQDIAKLYDLENLGIHESPTKSDNDVALEKFYESISFEENRYTVGWPWISLPEDTNYGLALGRFRQLIKKYKDQPKVLEDYQQIIDSYLENDIIEKVPLDEVTENPVYYIPHQPVIRLGKDMRVVLDASSKKSKKEKSINERLFRGPMLFENLCALIIILRLYKYGIVADIEKAFLQLRLLKKDRDVTRIFWLKDYKKAFVEGNVEIYRYKRVPFGFVSSPFLLNAVLLHHCKNADPKWKGKLKFYVDNLVCGANSDEEVQEFYNYAKDFMKDASMNLRQWASNSSVLNDVHDRELEDKIKLLGLIWDTKEDTLRLKNNLKEEKHLPCTKRNILSAKASLFDPVGFFNPWSLKSKLFFRDVVSEGHEWHEKLSNKDEEWKKIFEQISYLSKIEIPRSLYYGNVKEYELHVFTDASSEVFGSCVYLRQVYENEVKTDLLFSKQRLKPFKQKISIPRMELLALLMGVKSLEFIRSFLPLNIKNTYIWSDSKCALAWLKSDKILPMFVQKVIAEISPCEVTSFLYVNTLSNPADLLTRPQEMKDIQECELWWHGPEYLSSNSNSWKEEDVTLYETENFSEFCESFNEENVLTVHEKKTVESPFSIKAEEFSSFKKLMNVTKICVKFVKKSIDPMYLWLKYMQEEYFSNELSCIRNSVSSNTVRQLDLWIDKKGLIRCGGRLRYISSSGFEAYPILLSYKSPFIKLLIMHIHVRLMHIGVSHTLAEIRRTYWLTQSRRTIQNVLNSCIECNRCMSGPFLQPKMSILPLERIQNVLPFARIGVDIFGPYAVEDTKIYGMIFTCMSCRAVHLELAYNLTAKEISYCVRKFVARRGTPDLILSDNGSQLKTIVNHLEKVPDMNWEFIKELSPWAGGFYERLIGIIKQCLFKTTLHLSLTVREFEVVLIEAEYVLNSRPLTYVGGDDVYEFLSSSVLTPAKFLNLRSKNQDGLRLVENAKSEAGQNIIKSWKMISQAKEFFEECWRKLYLPSLRERYVYTHVQGRKVTKREPRIGEIVLISEEFVPRSKWRVGKIIELLRSKDGKIRSVKVKTNKSVLSRPINVIYPIEIDPLNSK